MGLNYSSKYYLTNYIPVALGGRWPPRRIRGDGGVMLWCVQCHAGVFVVCVLGYGIFGLLCQLIAGGFC